MKRSHLIAGGFTLAVSVWMLTGLLGKPAEPAPEQTLEAKPAALLTRVRVRDYTAEPMVREVVIHGQTEAKQVARLSAETAGVVAAVTQPRGAEVKAGDVLVRLAEDERGLVYQQASALVKQRELEYEAGRSLRKQNQLSASQLAESLTALRNAQTQLEQARLNRERAQIRAPFDGVLEERSVEVGDYLGIGDPVAMVVATRPVLASGPVSEREYSELSVGMPGQVVLSDGHHLAGQISYLSATSDTSTRTYTVELEIANGGQRVPLGMTAEIHLPLGSVDAHRLPPSMLSLNDAGVVGVKGVDADGLVQFYPVDLLKAERDGLWLSGIPASVRLITVGQGFVRGGDRVDAVSAE